MKRQENKPFLACVLALALLSGAAHADTPSDKAAAAEALFQEGRALMAKGDYPSACPKLKASHHLDPGYGVLFNLAECFMGMSMTASAWATYREAAGMAKAAGQKDRLDKAEKRAAGLDAKLEKMVVSVASPPPGLGVKRDGVALDPATWSVALPVDPGMHTVVVEAPNKKPWRSQVSTQGPGSTVTVAVPALEDAPNPAGTASVAPKPEGTASVAPTTPLPDDGRGTRRTVGLVVAGAGVAGVAVSAVMGSLASGKWSDAQDNHCRTDVLCDPTGVALASDAKTFATVSTALFIGGGALAVGGGVLFLLSLGSGKKEGASLAIVPSAGPKSGGISAIGRF